jgi:hypothetical protein
MITEKTYHRKSGNLYKKICLLDDLFISESKTKNNLSDEVLIYEIQINLKIDGSEKIIKVYKEGFKHHLEEEFNYLYNDTGRSYKEIKDRYKYFVIWMKKKNDKYLLCSENGRSIYRDNFKNSLITHLNMYSKYWSFLLIGPGTFISALFGINFLYFSLIIGVILFGLGEIKQLV